MKNLVKTALLVAAMMGGAGMAQAQSNNGIVTLDLMVFEGDIRPAVGFTVMTMPTTGIGVYGSLIGGIVREPYFHTISIGYDGDLVTDRFQNPFAFNVGLTQRINANFGVYAGVGYAWLDGQAEQFDPDRILAWDGVYYVSDPANDAHGFDGQVGVMFNFNAVAASASYHTYLDEFSFGVGVAF